MKTKKTIATILLCLSVMGTVLLGQKADTGIMRPPIIGLGFKVAQINISDLLESTMPGNKLLLTISPLKNLRLEGSVGYLKRTHESNTGKQLVGKSVFYGITALGMWQKGNTNFYAGPRFGILNYTDEQELQGQNPSTGALYYYTDETTGQTKTIGMVIGAEYFFARHFSIGAEIAVNSAKSYVKTPVQNGTAGTYDNNKDAKSVMTETGLVTRFYF